MKNRLFSTVAELAALLVLFTVLTGCPQPPADDTTPPPADDTTPPPADGTDDDLAAALATARANFPTSFHGDRHGKRTFYSASDGFEQITGIPIEQLACKKCHAATYADGTAVESATYTPSCRDCHVDPDRPADNPVTEQICLGCHGRQGAEQRVFSDVHRTAGMTCMNCHTQREMHGDGVFYPTFLSAGARDTACENCHVAGGIAPEPGSNMYHSIHMSNIHCSACHVKSVSTCYNCHFETEIALEQKRFFGQSPRTGFKMLMNYEGKVYPATFQALTYEGKSFVAIAPFFGHSVARDATASCGDCHLRGGTGNANVQEYKNTGAITVTRWDATKTGAERLVGPTGVIPVPEDWKTALRFAFLKYNGAATDAVNGSANLPLWDFLKGEADGSHAPVGTPLTAAQMNSLINY